MAEQWRRINGNQLYSISDHGRVRNEVTGRLLKPYPNREGKLQVKLRHNSGFESHMVHRLVAIHFMDHDEECLTHHISDDFTDNRVSNIQLSHKLSSPRRNHRE